MRGARLAAVVALVCVVIGVGTTAADLTAASATTSDALHTRIRAELANFTGWLAANNAKGYIGEVGWPDNRNGDAAQWNDLAQDWFAHADAAGLWVTGWASGEWWGSNYICSIYKRATTSDTYVDSPGTQASVIEAHPSTSSYLRGVNDNGGEFGGVPTSQSTSSFSNKNLGAYGTAYHYDSQATFNYLASRGVKIIRLPFRWERIQPNPTGPLDTTEVGRIRAAVDRAHAAGLQVILDMHNYGAYYLYNGTQGVRRAVGSSQIPISTYAQTWKLISQAFKGYPGVVAYGLMNEPTGLAATSKLTAAKVWEKASQSALNSIRANADTGLVMVPGYNWSGAQVWSKTHPKAWIADTAHNFRYEAHHYWDHNNSGGYATYSQEVAYAQAAGYTAS
jgi:hypothetical protein